ncbi:tetratricopeptide repeat protein [Kitasatospora sp. NPDC056651]|uniref:tetratricopeptide repeat protein n=1 Tax=Kitasatospora sp. NPDC056651 TaxID=3345892 RepID=UPI0036C9F4B4
MNSEPSIYWDPQYRGDGTRPEVLAFFEQFVVAPDGEGLATLKDLALSADAPAGGVVVGDLHALASAYLVTGQFDEAVPVLEFLADEGVEDPAVRCDLANVYIRIGSVDRAARELERVLAAHPGHVAAERQLVDVQAWLRWHEAGVELLRQQAGLLAALAAADDAGATEYLALARVLYQLAAVPRSGVDWPDVVSALERACDLHPGHEQALELLVAAAHHAGAEAQWHRALLALEEAAPGSEHLGQWRSVPPAVEPNPDRLLAVAADPAEVHGAVRELRSLYRRSPNNPDVLRCVVQAEVSAGNAAEALWPAESLAAVEGLDFYGHGALAMVYGMVGDRRAREHVAAALELAPDAAAGAEFLAQYDRLGEG